MHSFFKLYFLLNSLPFFCSRILYKKINTKVIATVLIILKTFPQAWPNLKDSLDFRLKYLNRSAIRHPGTDNIWFCGPIREIMSKHLLHLPNFSPDKQFRTFKTNFACFSWKFIRFVESKHKNGTRWPLSRLKNVLKYKNRNKTGRRWKEKGPNFNRVSEQVSGKGRRR